MSLPHNLSEQIAGRVRDNVSLADYATLEIGGTARWLLEVSTEKQLLMAWQAGADKDLPVLLLGGGSNVLVDNAGFPGLVTAILGASDQHLVESDERKCAFLAEAARLTDTNVTLHRARIEALEPLSADVITARALAPLAKLLSYAARHGAG